MISYAFVVGSAAFIIFAVIVYLLVRELFP